MPHYEPHALPFGFVDSATPATFLPRLNSPLHGWVGAAFAHCLDITRTFCAAFAAVHSTPRSITVRLLLPLLIDLQLCAGWLLGQVAAQQHASFGCRQFKCTCKHTRSTVPTTETCCVLVMLADGSYRCYYDPIVMVVVVSVLGCSC